MPMGNPTKRERDGGQEFHVADCYVWAEIHHLDSPTDYREYLPGNSSPQSGPRDQPLVFLDDDSSQYRWGSFGKSFLVWSILLLVILVIVRMLAC
jgi:hypothetical protein